MAEISTSKARVFSPVRRVFVLKSEVKLVWPINRTNLRNKKEYLDFHHIHGNIIEDVIPPKKVLLKRTKFELIFK